MELAVGQVLEGTVTGITKFGAFVSLEGGRSGLVHISEVANTFVNDVHDHVQIGQKVKVKVLSLGEAGKINLSIKRAAEAPRQNQPPRRPNPGGYQGAPRPRARWRRPQGIRTLRTGSSASCRSLTAALPTTGCIRKESSAAGDVDPFFVCRGPSEPGVCSFYQRGRRNP